MEDNVVLFADSAAAMQKVSATVYRKQLVAFGSWVDPIYPSRKMVLNEKWADQVVSNFAAKVIDKVPVPKNHTNDVAANTGELIGLEVVKGDGLYGLLEITDKDTQLSIEEGRTFNVSISFDRDYVDTKNGDKHGPVLLHVALVNNPYLKGLSTFQKVRDTIKKMSEALAPAHTASVIMLSESKAKELNTMLVTVKNGKSYKVTIKVKGEDGAEVEHVLEPGAETQVPKDQSESVLGQIESAVEPKEEETPEAKKAREDKEAADKKAEEDKKKADEGKTPEQLKAEADAKELAELRVKDRTTNFERKYEALLKDGKITPAQKDRFMSFAEIENQTVNLSGDKTVDLADLIFETINAGSKQIDFDESGSGKGGKKEDDDKKPSENLSDEETAGLQAVGVTPARMDELAEKDPVYAAELKKIDKQTEENKS